MIRITSAQISFHGFSGGSERASAISQRALGHLAASSGAPGAAGAALPRMQLTVRVPHGASDAAIAHRVGEALRHSLGRGSTT